MADKREIIHDVKHGFMHYTDIEKEDLNDFDVAMVIAEKFGYEGLLYLQENCLLIGNHIWEQLREAALSTMEKKYQIEQVDDDLTFMSESPFGDSINDRESAEESPIVESSLGESPFGDSINDREPVEEIIGEEESPLGESPFNDLSELELLYMQMQKKEKELETIKGRIMKLEAYQERVEEIERINGREAEVDWNR